MVVMMLGSVLLRVSLRLCDDLLLVTNEELLVVDGGVVIGRIGRVEAGEGETEKEAEAVELALKG